MNEQGEIDFDQRLAAFGYDDRSYGAFPKEANRFRVILGTANVGDSLDCAGETNTYPWRWGLNGPLAPGQQRTIVGYVRFRNPSNSERKITLRAGLVQEYVQYYAADVGATELTITFDPQTKTEANYDYLRFYKDASHTAYWGAEKYSGTVWPGVNGQEPLKIGAGSCVLSFHTDGSNT